MSASDGNEELPFIEVASNEPKYEEQNSKEVATVEILGHIDALLTRLLEIQQISNVSVNFTEFLPFNPDDPNADVVDWCNFTDAIVQNNNMEGMDLIIALVSSLKGRATCCLTKVILQEITWPKVKQKLIATFSKPKHFQNYFDEILRFQITISETASEAALRLWNLIEQIPKTFMPEETITGFVISVLCQKEDLIRDKLNNHIITSKAQLFKILDGVSLKRHPDPSETQEGEPQVKRFRVDNRFNGRCYFCGIMGHRISECRKRRENVGTHWQQNTRFSARHAYKQPAITYYTSG